MNKWRRAIWAFDTFQTGIYPNEDSVDLVEADVAFLRSEYEAHKRKLGFQEAAWRAKTMLLERIALEDLES